MQDGMIDLGDYTKSDWVIMLNDRVIAGFTLNEGSKVIIGRGTDADVVIDNTAISRHHSSLEMRDGRHYLADLKSTNGTTVNGKRIANKTAITINDLILLGKFQLALAESPKADAGASSYAKAMDLDEQTVFVSSQKQKTPPPAPAEEQPAIPVSRAAFHLTVVEGSARPQRLPLDGKSSIKIGNDPSCDMIVSGWFVGKPQCYLICRKDRYYIVPQTNWLVSTRLNNTAVKEEHTLRKGDVVQIKGVKIRFD